MNTKMRLLIAAMLILFQSVLSGCDRQASSPIETKSEEAETMIDIQLLEEMFQNIRNTKDWDADGELLWGYFFMDSDPKKLKQLADSLTAHEYRLVGIEEADDRSTHVLHIERVEKHTPETLHQRNLEFERIAAEFEVDSYDGMDVGQFEQ